MCCRVLMQPGSLVWTDCVHLSFLTHTVSPSRRLSLACCSSQRPAVRNACADRSRQPDQQDECLHTHLLWLTQGPQTLTANMTSTAPETRSPMRSQGSSAHPLARLWAARPSHPCSPPARGVGPSALWAISGGAMERVGMAHANGPRHHAPR